MKLKEIASQYGFDKDRLEIYLRRSAIVSYKDSFTGIIVEDSDVTALVDGYNQLLAEKAAAEKETAEKAAAEKKAADDKQAAIARILITSGFNFDGYTITKYSGYISGDDAVSVDRGTGGLFSSPTDVGRALMNSLAKIRRNALTELKEAAYALGCNAVIGVDFDYLTLAPEVSAGGGVMSGERYTEYLPYVFGVTANGNAVIIEKNKTAD